MRVPNFETGMLKWFFQLQDRKFEILNLSTIDNLKALCGVHTGFFLVYRSVYIVCGWFKQSVDTRWYKHVVSCWRFICQRSYSEWLPHSNRFWRYIVAYLNMYIKPFLPPCRTSFRMDVWHLVWLRWCAGTLIRRACMCLFTSTNPLSTGRQLVDSKTIKPSNHQTTLTIFHWIIHWNWDTAWHFSFVFLCWGGCQKPSENQATSLHYPLENIWLIFMKGQQDSFSAGGPVLQWSLHALPTECARHPADQLRAGRSSAASYVWIGSEQQPLVIGGTVGALAKKAKVCNTVL